jgi:hypothetical protein
MNEGDPMRMDEQDRLFVELVASIRGLAVAQRGGNIAAAKDRILAAAVKIAENLEKTAPPQLEAWIAQVEKERGA